MNRDQARSLIRQTFTQAFDKGRFLNFSQNLLNQIDTAKAQSWNKQYVKNAFRDHIDRYERLGTYTAPDDATLDVLVVYLTGDSKLERARTAIRNFVADHLKTRDEKDAAVVAFVSPSERQWRFSYVKMEYATVQQESGKIGVETRLTPARRFSYIVGEGESCHTAQTRFLELLQDTHTNPSLSSIEDAFSVEAVTKEFFLKYAELFNQINDALGIILEKDKTIRGEFSAKQIKTEDFAKKLMGQIVFLYFLQKKGWLGVEKGKDWGTGPHDFMRRLANGEYGKCSNFFNDVLEPLFYDTLATDRGHEAYCSRFKRRIPFLNGGLFEPLGDYDWKKTNLLIPNHLFTNDDFVEEGVTGTGILDIFDRYNFTVNEAEPLEKEVAIDPEMLGKVFENLIEDNRRKGLGAFYTPREIVHYMCQESLINYLDTALNKEKNVVPHEDIEVFIHIGEQISHYESVETRYKIQMPKTIEKNARLMDEALEAITVCDPAVGSGAFLVGMMTEIVRARSSLSPFFNDIRDRTPYFFKRHAIQNSLYGVDIDPGAVEIAKLRLWLSLVVDEEDVKQIKPLPNLDYKIVVGNSLLGIEENLLNYQDFDELERLKPLYFDEIDHEKKGDLKANIDELIHELTDGQNIFDFKIYFSEIFHNKHGFDVVVGNPPYGAKIAKSDLMKIKKNTRNTSNSNSAALFIDFSSNRIANSKGTVSLIVPKSLLFSEDWFSLVRSLLENTLILVDVEKAFDRVLLEQVVFVLSKSKRTDKYLARKFIDSEFVRETLIPNELVLIFEAWLCDVSDGELTLGKKIKLSADLLEKHVDAFRGFPIQRSIKTKGKYPVIGGKNLIRFGVDGVKGYLPESDFFNLGKKIDRLSQPKLMAQNLVAHIQNPKPHIQLTVSFDACGEIMNVDTVTNIIPTNKSLNPFFLLALLNSTLINWYAYKFIYCSAIRTMHFDRYYVGKIIIPKTNGTQHDRIVQLSEQIVKIKELDPRQDTSNLENEIDLKIYSLYGLTTTEIQLVEEIVRR